MDEALERVSKLNNQRLSETKGNSNLGSHYTKQRFVICNITGYHCSFSPDENRKGIGSRYPFILSRYAMIGEGASL